jgi:DNA-binding NarL/FixJ family response regulator
LIRILIADDQALVRAGFAMILGVQGDLTVVGEAGNGREAVASALALAPDVILMDIRMPDMNGLEATRELMASRFSGRVLVLTTYDADDYVLDALRAGASGFVLKDIDPPDLVHAVRSTHRGDALLAPAITRRLVERHLRQPDPRATTALARLTAREREILVLVARGLANDEIGISLHISGATVKTHLTRTFAKLGLRDRVQAVVLAYESGLVRPAGGWSTAENS